MAMIKRWHLRAATLTLALTVAGCAPHEGDSDSEIYDSEDELAETSQPYVSTVNGLRTFNGLTTTNGLRATNGLTTTNGLKMTNGLMTLNGLATRNGLRTTNGTSVDCFGRTSCTGQPDGLLSNTTGLMRNADGVSLATYVARCALRSNQSIKIKRWDNTLVTLTGGIGLAPEWLSGNATDANGICNEGCQEKVSACLMALTNASGVNVSVALTSPLSQIGTGTLSTHPYEEGHYFGNLFVSPPRFFVNSGAHYTAGRQLIRSCYVADARLGSSSPSNGGCMFKEPIRPCAMVSGTRTAAYCVADTDGNPTTTATKTWRNVITVWRSTYSASPSYTLYRSFDDGSSTLRVR